MNQKLPDYLPTGILDAKFLSDLQNKIPSVVLYFWNLNGCENKDKTCLSYMNTYKSNEKVLKPWGVTIHTIICYDQVSSNYSQPDNIEISIRDTVQYNRYFIRDSRDLEALLSDMR